MPMVLSGETSAEFQREFYKGNDQNFQQLIDCTENSLVKFINILKLNFLDNLVGRTLTQKARLHCNLHCIRQLKIQNCKYGGRWVFMYVLGFTEIFSSLFALLKFIKNCINFRKFNEKMKTSPIRIPVLFHFFVMTGAFLFSFLFHLHENVFTRKGDYFSAVLGILASANSAFLRNLHIFSPQLCSNLLNPTTFLIISVFIYHVYVMNFVSFDYHYNFKFCTLFVIFTKINEILTCIHYRHAKLNIAFAKLFTATILAALFEVSDFPPLFFLLDSHAMWHLSLFLSLDAFYEFTFFEIDLYSGNNKVPTQKLPKDKN